MLNAVGSLFGLLILITGLRFAYGSFLSHGKYGMEYLRSGIVAMVIILFILLQTLFCCGVVISNNRKISKWMLIAFGLVTFFFVSIPLMHEGSQLKKIASVTELDLKRYCFHRNDLHQYQKTPKWIREIFMVAARYDDVADMLLNRNMCTDKCPCYNEYSREINGNIEKIFKE